MIGDNKILQSQTHFAMKSNIFWKAFKYSEECLGAFLFYTIKRAGNLRNMMSAKLTNCSQQEYRRHLRVMCKWKIAP